MASHILYSAPMAQYVDFHTPKGVITKSIPDAKHIAALSGNIAELNAALQNPGIEIPIGTRSRVPQPRNAKSYAIAL